MNALRYTIERQPGGALHVTLSGTIDEQVPLEELFGKLDADTSFDLRDVARINSIGIRHWIPLIGALSNKWKVTLERLSYVFVTQANCISNLFGAGVVRSCMAPYFCGKCATNQIIEIPASEIATTGSAPARSCEKCKTPLEFDDLDSYFAFLHRARK